MSINCEARALPLRFLNGKVTCPREVRQKNHTGWSRLGWKSSKIEERHEVAGLKWKIKFSKLFRFYKFLMDAGTGKCVELKGWWSKFQLKKCQLKIKHFDGLRNQKSLVDIHFVSIKDFHISIQIYIIRNLAFKISTLFEIDTS